VPIVGGGHGHVSPRHQPVVVRAHCSCGSPILAARVVPARLLQ
jgi:hypothetical protein